MLFIFKKTKETVLDILFPPICLICGKTTDDPEKTLCAGCCSKIEIETTLTCPICKARMAENVKICHRDSQFRLAAASRYDNPFMRQLIYDLKFGKKAVAGKAIAGIIFQYLDSLRLPLASFTIIPVPLHPSRMRQRGFNQADIIAENLSKKIGIPVVKTAIIRIKSTKAQAEIKGAEERKNNLEGAFAVPYPALIENKNILLVDDVFTSGATTTEAVKSLKSAGCGKIIAAVAAKA